MKTECDVCSKILPTVGYIGIEFSIHSRDGKKDYITCSQDCYSQFLKENNHCFLCKTLMQNDKYYEQEVVEKEEIIPVAICEPCMDDINKCKQCGANQPYCSDCVL
jgi:hypothetical protein